MSRIKYPIGTKVICIEDCETINGSSKCKKGEIKIVYGTGTLDDKFKEFTKYTPFWFKDTERGAFIAEQFELYIEEPNYEVY